MKTVKWVAFLGVVLFLLTAPVSAQPFRITSTGIGVDTGASPSYLNFDATDGASGFGFRDNNGELEYKPDTGDSWMKFNELGPMVWKQNGSYVYPADEETNSSPYAWVCIGNQTPETLLHIYDFGSDNLGGEDHTPQINVYQDGAGDASQTFRLQFDGGNRQHFTLGIDKRYSDPGSKAPESNLVSMDFKICHEYYKEVGGTVPATLGYLKGEVYSDAAMMMRIHGADWTKDVPVNGTASVGIIDFNHQSRARYFAVTPINMATPGLWTPVSFDSTPAPVGGWDEHGEVKAIGDCDGSGTPCSRFIANEDGYYQVNSRIEFLLQEGGIVPGDDGVGGPPWDGYVSIAIYHYTGSTPSLIHSQGNNLQIINAKLYLAFPPDPENPGFSYKNNAPNVSDVIYLNKGEGVEIWMWQNTGTPIPLDVITSLTLWEKNYFSIHKIS